MMKAFYLNLPDRTDRNQVMIENWSGIVDLERVEATKGSVPLHSIYNNHWKIVTHLYETDQPLSLILEDDVIPCKDFDKRFDLFYRELPDNWDIFMLGFFSTEHSQFKQVNTHIYKALCNICAGQSYIVNPNSYEKVLKYFGNKEYGSNLDVLLMEFQKTNEVFITIPTFTYQYLSKSDHNSSGSAEYVSEVTKKYYEEWM